MKHFGYWVFGKDMNNVPLETLKKNGVTDIFLNYYAFTAHGESKVLAWIKNAKTNGINTHIWVQCFYDGEWHNPKTTNLTSKLKEIKKYANLTNVYGVHLDYLRYPGNAYKTDGGADAITAFVKKVRSQNPKTFLSCAVMPESDDKYYYGQDIASLGKIVDAILPMQYKGNYNAGTSWLTSTTKQFSKDATIWSGLQTYKSDDDETQLSSKELLNDSKTCISAGAKGAILFRYGITPNVNFTSLQDKEETKKATTKKHTYKEIVDIAQKCKTNVETKYKLGINTAWTYYICKAVMKVNTNFTKIGTIKEAPKPSGNTINIKVPKKEYFKMAKTLIKEVEETKTLPNNLKAEVDSKTYKVRVRDYLYMFSRILVYYNKKGKFPKTAKINSKSFNKPTTKTTTTTTTTKTTTLKKYGHATDHCCDDMGQNNSVYCGPHSMQEVIRNLTGKVISQDTLASWAGTGSSGTDHEGIETAIAMAAKKLGVKFNCKWYSFSELGWSGVKKIIDSNNQDCIIHNLYRDAYGHYEVVNKIYNNYSDVQNSLGDKCSSGCYYGYVEERYHSTFESYINGISQKSVLVVTREG